MGEKFIVFESELDLQAHSVRAHGQTFSDQKSRREARRVETNFTYEEPPSSGSSRGGGRARGGRAIEAAPAEFVEPGKRVIPGFGPTVNKDTRVVRGGNQTPTEGSSSKGKSGANTPVAVIASTLSASDAAIAE